MAFTEAKFNKQLAVANIKLEEISELSNSGYVEDISLANEQIGALISRLEKSKDGQSIILSRLTRSISNSGLPIRKWQYNRFEMPGMELRRN